MPSVISEEIRNKMLAALDRGDDIEELAESITEESDLQSRLRAFAMLENWRRELDTALKLCKKEIERIAGPLAEDMVLAGVQNQRTEGLTIYLKEELFVNKVADKDGVTTQDVCDALRDCGLGYMVSDGYAAGSLKSKVREMLDNDIEIPARLQSVLKIATASKLATRK